MAPRAAATRPLTRTEERNLRRLMQLAREEGGRAVAAYGATIFLPRPGAGAEQQAHAAVPSESGAQAQREALPLTKECDGGLEAPPAAANARQRRSMARLRKFQEEKARQKLLSCGLRKVLMRAMKVRRWQRVQAVWTSWMRQNAAAPDVRMIPAGKRSWADKADEADDECGASQSDVHWKRRSRGPDTSDGANSAGTDV